MHMHNGIEQPIEGLYAAYAPTILRYLACLTGNHETVEDLMQDTFIKVLRHRGQFAVSERMGAWLFRIATNTAYDDFRRHRHRTTMRLTDVHAETLIAVSRGLPVEERDLLWAVLDQLPEHYRVPLLLQSYAGYGVSDIAALLSLKEGTVKSRLNRARALFQKRYLAAG
jgi:RNA polymerase sigma-70 factor (ECF subfamily)